MLERAKLADSLAAMKDAAIRRALDAWSLYAGGATPDRIDVIRAPRLDGKSVVFGLGPVGPQGEGVVAKELLADAASVELEIYREVLPRISLRGPDLIGHVDSTEPGRAWLFLEEIGGPPFQKRDSGHVAIATQWLAAFHVGTSGADFAELLSERGPEHYTGMAAATVTELDEVSENPALGVSDHDLLRRLSWHLSMFLAFSDSFGDVFRSLPSGLVHGDFKGNNMAFSSGVGLRELRVFDWSEAHRGPYAIDTWGIRPDVYRAALVKRGLDYPVEEIDLWSRLGSLARWVAATSWEMPRLGYGRGERSMRRLAYYERRLRSALEKIS